jgi:hypothetical protein
MMRIDPWSPLGKLLTGFVVTAEASFVAGDGLQAEQALELRLARQVHCNRGASAEA